jgi:hypothetical protein
MVPGANITIAERFAGLLVMSAGRSIHTIESGTVLTIKKLNEIEGLVEVKCNCLRLLVSRENLEHCGRIAACAG